MKSEYGESGHYDGKTGEDYFAWQNSDAELGAEINSFLFEDYIHEEDTVIDFGCGGGWMLKQLNPKRKVGIELNQTAHPVCKQNGVDVYTRLSDVEDNAFNRIISSHCLEHVPYPIEALKQLREKLTDNGVMILVVPIDDWRCQQDFSAEDIDHHLHTWTPRLMANTLAEAGLRTIDATVIAHAWPKDWQKRYKKLSKRMFNRRCRQTAINQKRRQLRVLAEKS